jgi:hypothetical protein
MVLFKFEIKQKQLNKLGKCTWFILKEKKNRKEEEQGRKAVERKKTFKKAFGIILIRII